MSPTPEQSQEESSREVATAMDVDVPDSQCSHLLEIWKDETEKSLILRRLKCSVVWSSGKQGNGSHVAKKRKIVTPTCSTCHLTLVRPFACLRCSFAACWKDSHITSHLLESGHCLAVDLKSCSIFCSSCDDFIQSSLVDEMFASSTVNTIEKQIHFRDPKKTREKYSKWVPTPSDQEAITRHGVNIPCQGRRGLLNLGQTCAMNTVLQSFIHNPMLRNYFLSDKHNAKLCKVTKDCMCCEMDKLFAEFFSEDRTPYGPLTFLPVLWRSSASSSTLSQGYAQHDAHEVFITCVSQIHTNSKGSTNVSCNCIIHSTFAGGLLSELKCGKASCGHTSVKVDPMLDVSLELKGKGVNNDPAENTLGACLRRYTKSEKLGPKEYTCSKCESTSDATKTLSISKLPPVLAFQLKRFGHKTSDKSAAQKINTFISFPTTLNMFPYTSISSNPKKVEPGPESMYLYDLFCVLNHEGVMDNGHYTNFARWGDEWYRFDDDKVTHATLTQVLSSTAYILFYVKRNLDYKPNTRPSYIVARETEALREKQREKEKELKLSQEIDDELMSML